MSGLLNYPLPVEHTKRYHSLCLADLSDTEMVVAAKNGAEDRDNLPLWIEISEDQPARMVWVTLTEDKERITIERNREDPLDLYLRDERGLADVLGSEQVLIDITGLPHSVWAPMLKVAHDQKIKIRVLYAEPESYKLHKTPASATLFDLSESIEGLAPLPGFAQLSGPEDENKCIFVALLGFEGNRPERLAIQIDPAPKVIPVVGVPGFRLEYPAHTVTCNRGLLKAYSAFSDLRYARASCPFEIYEILQEIRKDYPEHYIYLAPVGTKPHSVGAVWYAISDPNNTEILFDYPVRKRNRTSGVGVIHIYDLGKFHAD